MNNCESVPCTEKFRYLCLVVIIITQSLNIKGPGNNNSMLEYNYQKDTERTNTFSIPLYILYGRGTVI